MAGSILAARQFSSKGVSRPNPPRVNWPTFFKQRCFNCRFQTIELFGSDSSIELTLKYNIQQGYNSKARLQKKYHYVDARNFM